MADKNVLIYEKDDKFVKALKLYFRGSPYDAESVASDVQIFATAKRKRPDAILAAFEADDAEARRILQQLGSDDATQGIPVIVMSTKKDERELFASGLGSVGASAFIKKPFIKKAILDVLDSVLSGTPRPAPAAGGKKKGGVDLGSILGEIEGEIDTFFEGDKKPGAAGGEDDLTISFEDEGGAAPSAPAPAAAPPPAPAFAAAPEPLPVMQQVVEPVPAMPVVAEPAELKRLRERIRELEGELRQKSEEHKTVAREKERLEHSVGKKESELLEKIKSLEKDNQDLEEDIKKKKPLIAQMTATVQGLNEDLEAKDKKHETEVEGWKAQLAKLQKDYDELGEKSSNQAHDIEDKTEEIARQSRRIADLEAERDELQGNLEKMTQMKEDGDRTIADLRDQIAALSTKLANTEQELATERSRIAAAKDTFERRISGLREALGTEMADVRQTIESGLTRARESVDRHHASAQQTLEEGIAALLGNPGS